MIVAKWDEAASDGPRALFYGHYDVQPVDPLELWDRDPFDPAVETRADGSKKIVARGACDDKGQIMTFIEACRACIDATGTLPIPITIIFEGEEESGSPSLPGFLDAHAEDLKADVALVCDTNMWDARRPPSPRACAVFSAPNWSSKPPTKTCIPACSVARRATPPMCWHRLSPTCTMKMGASPCRDFMTA
jgi:hypothetical protein